MLQLKQLYSTVIREPKYGVQGYHVDKKYFDSRRSREQKILVNSKERSSTMKPSLASKKSNFLDQILRKEAKLPGPSTYSPKQYERSVQKIKVQSPPRMTYIQQMQKMQQKYNFPAPGKYDKLETEVDKTKKQSSGLSKAEVCNYLDNSMRNSIEKPGVGSYNAKIQLFDKKGVIIWKKPKEVKDKKSMSQRGIKAAEVGTYTPIPVSYEIFDSISHLKPKKSKSYFNKQQRFKNSKDKAVPFYNVGSEWGMKDKIHKKDILSRVGSSLNHHSIYY